MLSLFAESTTATLNAAPVIGTLIFVLGGMAGAVFYLPFKKVKNWAWESYWFIYALFGLIIVPWILAFCTSPNVVSVLTAAPHKALGYCFLCGAMWGFGGLTWGLMIRYLGFGLGLAIGGGLCSATGTLLPPILKPVLGRFFDDAAASIPLGDAIQNGLHTLYGTSSAKVALLGVLVSLIGIALVGGAGMSKEGELPEEEKKKAVAEFSFKKGVIVAIFSGIMSGGMSLGLQGGAPIEALALKTAPITDNVWKGMPVLVVVLLGGFAVNGLWCLFLNVKNKTTGDYVKSSAPLAANLFFAALAGAIWTSQFICFKTGEPKMGDLAYVGWSVLFASCITFGTLLGIALGEWRNTSSRTRLLLTLGLLCLVASSVISGYSGYLSLHK
jgi:L-rhamnose-H+ transport protein